jgi:hypothetical protein
MLIIHPISYEQFSFKGFQSKDDCDGLNEKYELFWGNITGML